MMPDHICRDCKTGVLEVPEGGRCSTCGSSAKLREIDRLMRAVAADKILKGRTARMLREMLVTLERDLAPSVLKKMDRAIRNLER